jgi:AAA domain
MVTRSPNGKPRAHDAADTEETWLAAIKRAVVTSSELRAMRLKTRKRLLGDWFCEGDLGFVYAARGVGKTWLTLLIARALSEAGKVGDWQAHERAKVLYIDGEMPPDLMRERDRGLERNPGEVEFLNHEILFDRTGKVLNITKSDVQQAITARCIETGVKLLVLDNLSTVASGMKENDTDAWEMVNNWLLDFRRRKIAVILVHHAGRNGEMRGASKREDNAFWIIVLDDAKKQADDKRGARFISRFTKPSRNTPDEIPAYEWHVSTDAITGEITVTHKQAQSLDVFRKLIEEGVTECGQLAEELKVSSGTISKWAHKAIQAGWLRKEGRGYALAE